MLGRVWLLLLTFLSQTKQVATDFFPKEKKNQVLFDPSNISLFSLKSLMNILFLHNHNTVCQCDHDFRWYFYQSSTIAASH